jgi:hypothetical protein
MFKVSIDKMIHALGHGKDKVDSITATMKMISSTENVDNKSQ